jgi:hypothetical protein
MASAIAAGNIMNRNIMNNRDTHVPGIPKMVQHREGKS